MIPVYFLGPKNSYSHEITKHVLTGDRYTLIPTETFKKIVEKILQEKDAIGVLPIENSITSDIHENIDALFKNPFAIITEGYMTIALQLIGLPNAELTQITDVYSHTRAIAQCTNFISNHHIKTHEVTSTAKGKDVIVEKQEKNLAAIGSRTLVKKGITKILAGNIGNDVVNMTRFAFVSQQQKIENSKQNKASIIFKVPHVPGSLANILTKFAALDVNVTKIESRPIPGTSWEYHFWVDVEKEDLKMENIQEILQKETTYSRILGTYTKGEIFEN